MKRIVIFFITIGALLGTQRAVFATDGNVNDPLTQTLTTHLQNPTVRVQTIQDLRTDTLNRFHLSAKDVAQSSSLNQLVRAYDQEAPAGPVEKSADQVARFLENPTVTAELPVPGGSRLVKGVVVRLGLGTFAPQELATGKAPFQGGVNVQVPRIDLAPAFNDRLKSISTATVNSVQASQRMPSADALSPRNFRVVITPQEIGGMLNLPASGGAVQFEIRPGFIGGSGFRANLGVTIPFTSVSDLISRKRPSVPAPAASASLEAASGTPSVQLQ
ncbi:MAG: hypothetical protein KGI60_02880 [Patescibacteria group bacterium]|nr:hypothetical protein [Patescibacteria group bacterium]